MFISETYHSRCRSTLRWKTWKSIRWWRYEILTFDPVYHRIINQSNRRVSDRYLFLKLNTIFLQAQIQVDSEYAVPTIGYQSPPMPSAPSLSPTESHNANPIYPALAGYVGLDLTESTIALNMPEYTVATRPAVTN